MAYEVNKFADNRPLRSARIICAAFCVTVLHFGVDRTRAADPITSSGLNTQVNLSSIPPTGAAQFNITGGIRAGTNLFHSFGDFSVPNNNIANFLNDTGQTTSNILGRVTGGRGSDILGTIQTTGFGNANLFLMNPSGIVFGPNASLNVGGSVTFTTADYLRFTDNGRFHANPNVTTDALLSAAPVAAFGFLGSNPGAINVQGSQLTVPDRQGISLIGGDIAIQNGTLDNGTLQSAHLSAPNGQINLATAKSSGQFLVDLPVGQAGPSTSNVNDPSFRSFGSIHLEPGSTVDVSQTGNGRVSILGGQLALEIRNAFLDTSHSGTSTIIASKQDTIVLAPRSSIISQTFSADRGPDIQIVADRLQFLGSPPPSPTTFGTPVNIWTRTHGSGDAGNITLQATGHIELANYVDLESTSGTTPDGMDPSPILTPGNAGNIELRSARGNIVMSGFPTFVTSQTGNSSGKTGNIAASAPVGDVIILDGASFFVSNDGEGSPGQVQIEAKNLLLDNGLVSNDNRGQSNPGNIIVTLTGSLRLEGSSQIYTSSVTDASAGDINLTARDIVATQESIINSATFESGPGGHIQIITDTLQVMDGAKLSSGSTRAPRRDDFPQNINPTGHGGDITIRAEGSSGSVLIDGIGSGIFADTEGPGTGGNISLTAGRSILLNNGGAISASSTGSNSGSAGKIFINAGQQLDLLDHSSITTTTQSRQANGGNIDIRSIDRVRLVNNSTISTSVSGAEGSGGNIFIDPKVVMLEGSNVTAQAVGGTGGNITFVTPLFLADSASVISASSQRGVSGTVTIQSPTSNLSGTVGQLASKTNPPQVLLQNRCTALAGGEQSTFLLAGRDALPAEPGGWLSSPVAMEHWTGEETEEHVSRLMVRSRGWNRQPPLVMSKDETTVLSLRRLTPPGFLIRTFATDTTGCPA